VRALDAAPCPGDVAGLRAVAPRRTISARAAGGPPPRAVVARAPARRRRRASGGHRQLWHDARRDHLRARPRRLPDQARGLAGALLPRERHSLRDLREPRRDALLRRHPRPRSRHLHEHEAGPVDGVVARLLRRAAAVLPPRLFARRAGHRRTPMNDRAQEPGGRAQENDGSIRPAFLCPLPPAPRPLPSYVRARWLWLRALGGIFFSAFFSL